MSLSDRLRQSWYVAPGVLIAVATRVPHLSRPSVLVFDEIFYANDALDLIEHGVEMGAVRHPSAGKWLIAAGELVAGFSPLGWRLGALVAGLVVVVLTAVLARTLTGSAHAGALAGIFVAVDGISFTTGRLAFLDGFFAAWTTAGVLAIVHVIRNHDERPPVVASLIAVGCFSLAVATKWSALPLLIGAVLIIARRDRRHPFRSIAAHVAIAVLIYSVVHVGWVTHGPPPSSSCDERSCAAGLNGLVELGHHQLEMMRFHLALERRNSQLAPGWNWAFGTQSTVLFERECPAGGLNPSIDGVCRLGEQARVVARSNPVVWLGGVLAAAATLGGAARRRLSAPDRASVVLVAAAAILWLPWFFSGSYSFYGAAVVPLLASILSMRLANFRRTSMLVTTAAIAWFIIALPDLSAGPFL